MAMVEVCADIGFADSEFRSYERTTDTLIVRVRAWNGKLLLVRFDDVVGARDCLPGDITGLYEHTCSTDFLVQTLGHVYENVPDNSPYKHFAFTNLDDQPSLEVIAAECAIRALRWRAR